ncbi:aminodeoxychorismate lyase [Pontibacterium granulatum]|uniref:aminodeoxychorismate lyase n=1 Tax=Pontibacterium granulatum TaxID=2036029 RepID=UPI00249B03CB|nr:aminodeoxychorismate lyase [Pontibacterium granulatum]MDI3326236.1 aminodeoxychorismate lyase [Pontibacterium granulatum]
MTQTLWINGKQQTQIDVRDRGFAYGDGLFETIQISHGKSQLMARHITRMRSGAVRLGFDASVIDQLLEDLAEINLPDDGVLKLTLSRGVGGRGYSYAADMEATRVIMLGPKPAYGNQAEEGITLKVCDTRLGVNPALAGIKHLNRLEQVLARNEWSDPAINEGVVLDYEGFVVEGTMSNLFWVKDRVIYTPSLERCGVAGVVRDFLIEKFTADGHSVEVGLYPLADVISADEIFICNSLIDIWPVKQLDSNYYALGPVAKAARTYLVEEYQA